MKKQLLGLGVVVALSAAGWAGEWQPLFNGKNLEGWTFDVLDHSAPEEIFGAAEGKIIIRGEGKPTAVMQTVESFDDFELTFEWRWPGKPGNSGCLLYCSTPRNRNVWPQSIEVQVESGNAGDLITIGEEIQVPEAQRLTDLPKGSWKVRLRPNLTDDSEKPPGEWNRMHIDARDGVVTVHVNGVLVNRGYGATAKPGRICLQSEKADVEYRDVRIRAD